MCSPVNHHSFGNKYDKYDTYEKLFTPIDMGDEVVLDPLPIPGAPSNDRIVAASAGKVPVQSSSLLEYNLTMKRLTAAYREVFLSQAMSNPSR